MTIRSYLYELLEDEEARSVTRTCVDWVIIALIVISVGVSILASEVTINQNWHTTFTVIEWVCVLAFSIEFILRLWVAVEDRAGRYVQPITGRLRYLATPMAIVDLLAILPFYLHLFFPIDLLVLRAIRVLRVLKLTRYSPALSLFEVVLFNQRHALLAALSIAGVVLIVAASILYSIERNAQPEAFASIPRAMWWAVITMTTVGYGDVTPITPLGQFIASIVAFLGIGMFALPTAILGAGFTQELQKQNFANTAMMVARVPLFQDFSPAELAEVATLLQSRSLPARYTIMRRGDYPDSMYFISEGKIVVRMPNSRKMLAAGDFFGERGLLQGKPRAATVITLTNCRLLELRSHDFQRIVERRPESRERLERLSQEKTASEDQRNHDQ